MVFSGAVFLYAFLPLTLAVYALAPHIRWGRRPSGAE